MYVGFSYVKTNEMLTVNCCFWGENDPVNWNANDDSTDANVGAKVDLNSNANVNVDSIDANASVNSIDD